ncbi:MAG: F0F1 ATP synthase subunit gamma, partial [Erysipelotrichaceae bacterium]|nr:F0F1 ATP synthase subunit gamma [Erysipelotrichaceae bacterium]
MAQSRQVIKNRLRSIDSTKKITRVMQLIASTELSKQRRAMEENAEYASSLETAMHFALEHAQGNDLTQENEDGVSYVFVMTSDMGLCG